MEKISAIWRSTPAVAKYAMALLIAGWLLHYAFYFLVFADEMPEKTTYLQLGVGIGICYCVATARKWARMLCVYFNVGIIALYVLYSLALAHSDRLGLFVLAALITLLFSGSTLFLLKKETALFFKSSSAAGDGTPA
jgi:hypothetical protein